MSPPPHIHQSNGDRHPPRDRGSILPLTLILCVVFGVLGIAIGGLTIASLRSSGVTDRHLAALASAEGGARYGIERLNAKVPCDEVNLIKVPEINSIVPEVSCGLLELHFGCFHEYLIHSTAEVEGLTRSVEARWVAGTTRGWTVVNGSFSVELDGGGEPDCTPPPGPCDLVGFPTPFSSVSSDTLIMPKPSQVEPGDLLIAAVTIEGALDEFLGTPDPAWNTLFTEQLDGELGMRVFWRIAEAGDTTYSFPVDGKSASSGIFAARSCDSLPFGPSAGASGDGGDSSPNMIAPSVNATAAGNTLLTFFGSKEKGAPHSGPAGMIRAYVTPAEDFRSSAWVERSAEAGPTGTRNGGSADGDPWVAISLVLLSEPASDATTTTTTTTTAPATTTTTTTTTAPPPSACVLVGQSSTDSESSTITISQPAGTEIGDVLIASVTIESELKELGNVSSTWTTVTDVAQSSNVSMRTYQRVATATSQNYSFGTSGKKSSGGMLALRCSNGAASPIAANATANGSSGDMVAAAVSPAESNTVLVTFYGSKKKEPGHSAPSGMTRAYVTAEKDFRSSAHTQTLASSGSTGTRSAGTSGGDSWVAITLAIGN
jgi:hypothetical protein